jgi:hypothetical protein
LNAGARQPPSPLACWHAAHTRCGVASISSVAPASPAMAFAIAFIKVAIEAVVAASPTPFTPSGLMVAGTGCNVVRSLYRGRNYDREFSLSDSRPHQ